MVFMDESEFRLLPALVSTYSRRGHTPALEVPLMHDHLSVIDALTLDGKRLTWIEDPSVKGPDIIRFLKHLLAHIPGKILLIWNHLSAHHGQIVREYYTANHRFILS